MTEVGFRHSVAVAVSGALLPSVEADLQSLPAIVCLVYNSNDVQCCLEVSLLAAAPLREQCVRDIHKAVRGYLPFI
jgi:hypothetical protein